jgi:DNA topoisomerase-1
MEENLDKVADGKLDWKKLVEDFYVPFKHLIDKKMLEIKKKDIVTEETEMKCPSCSIGKLVVKLGRYGKFYSCDRYPVCTYARSVDEDDSELGSDNSVDGEKCPICKKDTLVYSRVVGYLRPVSNWNKSKKQEFKLRHTYNLN